LILNWGNTTLGSPVDWSGGSGIERSVVLLGDSWHLLETVEHLDFVIGSVGEVVDTLPGGLSLDGVPSGVLGNSLGELGKSIFVLGNSSVGFVEVGKISHE